MGRAPHRAVRPKIEILFFDGCPGYETAAEQARRLVAAPAMDAEIELRRVDSLEAAEAERFLGSPTVRVDGRDIDPTSAGRTDYGLKCRLYRAGGSASSVPPEEWLRVALERARRAAS